jgi:Ca2+-binding EF-hand superfamily protein
LPDATDEPGAAAAGVAMESAAPPVGMVTVPNDDAIFSLLTRFQMIRHVSTCFKYIQKTRAVWGDLGSRKRRNMLVSRLSATQRTEFSEIFALMDVNGDGCLELNELKRLLDSIGDISSEELKSVLQVNDKNDDDCANADPKAIDVENCVGPGVMTYEDYMGIMAEAEFYYLFRDIFASLDVQGSGYVKASDLDRVLCGVRDLISDDRKSVIDVDDKDMLIDYEQFSRMLLGTTLI